MAYRAEFSIDPAVPFAHDFLFVDKRTGEPIRIDDTTHTLVVHQDWCDRDDGWWMGATGGFVVASTANGRITHPDRGVVAVTVPSFAQSGIRPAWRTTLLFRLTATSRTGTRVATLVAGTLSFGA